MHQAPDIYLITCTVRPGLVSCSFYAIPISPLLICKIFHLLVYIVLRKKYIYIFCIMLIIIIIINIIVCGRNEIQILDMSLTLMCLAIMSMPRMRHACIDDIT